MYPRSKGMATVMTTNDMAKRARERYINKQGALSRDTSIYGKRVKSNEVYGIRESRIYRGAQHISLLFSTYIGSSVGNNIIGVLLVFY